MRKIVLILLICIINFFYYYTKNRLEDKALIFAAAMFLDYLHFEENPN